MSVLSEIQATLNAPKNLHNKFGGYNYRSCESILEALKPHLKANKATILLFDEMIEVGGRVYVKATAQFTADKEIAHTTAYAREAETKKGMDASQITGAASSYARKYALNGLFAIDDTKDADGANNHQDAPETSAVSKEQAQEIQALIDEVGADQDAFLKFFKIADVFEIPAKEFKRARQMLETKRKAK